MTTIKTHRIGIDLGGAKTEAILLDPEDRILVRQRIDTPRQTQSETEYRGILEAVNQFIRDTLALVPPDHGVTIGVGMPGAINPSTQLVQNANTTCLIGRPFQKDLEALLERPVGMDNDANCFTLAEALQGAGRDYAVVFGIIMGSGCGGGLSLNGRIHRGRHCIAGEWGHVSMDPGGADCYCGKQGCVETKISGGGVEHNYQIKYGKHLSMKQITQGYRQGDQACASVFEQFLDDYGRCLGGLISILDPDAVILGGGLSNIDELYTLGLEKVRQYAFQECIQTPILKNALGDSAGVFGAAWIGV
jgi:fructokinase